MRNVRLALFVCIGTLLLSGCTITVVNGRLLSYSGELRPSWEVYGRTVKVKRGSRVSFRAELDRALFESGGGKAAYRLRALYEPGTSVDFSPGELSPAITSTRITIAVAHNAEPGVRELVIYAIGNEGRVPATRVKLQIE